MSCFEKLSFEALKSILGIKKIENVRTMDLLHGKFLTNENFRKKEKK